MPSITERILKDGSRAYEIRVARGRDPVTGKRKFGKRYNFPGLHPHTLRHTMATVSIANGADVVSVSKKLGHAVPSITLNIYSHAN